MTGASHTDPPVLTSLSDGVGIIELARPAVFNCMSSEMLSLVSAGLERFEQSREARVILIVAAGKNFCTGAALDEVEAARGTETTLRQYLERGHAMLDRLEASPLPVIGAVQGLCLAGGVELALACDVLFAAEDARFGDQHAAFGLIPGWGGSQRLTRSIGLRRSLDLMYSARWIDAATALQWGLANYVVPTEGLREEATAYARLLAARSRHGLAATTRLARYAASEGLVAGLNFEIMEATRVLSGADSDEGLAAFKARRAPVFAS